MKMIIWVNIFVWIKSLPFVSMYAKMFIDDCL